MHFGELLTSRGNQGFTGCEGRLRLSRWTKDVLGEPTSAIDFDRTCGA